MPFLGANAVSRSIYDFTERIPLLLFIDTRNHENSRKTRSNETKECLGGGDNLTNRLIRTIWAASQENLSSGFHTRSDTNRAVKPQKMARGLKFRIQEVEVDNSENKGADQLRGYRATDLRLCYRICEKQVFS